MTLLISDTYATFCQLHFKLRKPATSRNARIVKAEWGNPIFSSSYVGVQSRFYNPSNHIIGTVYLVFRLWERFEGGVGGEIPLILRSGPNLPLFRRVQSPDLRYRSVPLISDIIGDYRCVTGLRVWPRRAQRRDRNHSQRINRWRTWHGEGGGGGVVGLLRLCISLIHSQKVHLKYFSLFATNCTSALYARQQGALEVSDGKKDLNHQLRDQSSGPP